MSLMIEFEIFGLTVNVRLVDCVGYVIPEQKKKVMKMRTE